MENSSTVVIIDNRASPRHRHSVRGPAPSPVEKKGDVGSTIRRYATSRARYPASSALVPCCVSRAILLLSPTAPPAETARRIRRNRLDVRQQLTGRASRD